MKNVFLAVALALVSTTVFAADCSSGSCGVASGPVRSVVAARPVRSAVSRVRSVRPVRTLFSRVRSVRPVRGLFVRFR